MKLIIEKHLNLKNVLTKLKVWNLNFEVEYVDNIQDKPFEISASEDRSWSIIMPKESVAFIYDYNKHKDSTSKYAGGAFVGRFSVIVFGDETEEILELRIIHEYLHSIGKDSDKCTKHFPTFLPFFYRLLYMFGLWKPNCDAPYTQRIFYKWMMKQ